MTEQLRHELEQELKAQAPDAWELIATKSEDEKAQFFEFMLLVKEYPEIVEPLMGLLTELQELPEEEHDAKIAAFLSAAS